MAELRVLSWGDMLAVASVLGLQPDDLPPTAAYITAAVEAERIIEAERERLSGDGQD